MDGYYHGKGGWKAELVVFQGPGIIWDLFLLLLDDFSAATIPMLSFHLSPAESLLNHRIATKTQKKR